MNIRQSEQHEANRIIDLVRQAFANEPYSDQSEHELVARLFKAEDFIPELSIIAEVDEVLVGFILLTPITIAGEEGVYESLALAPVAVLPAHQNTGIGSKLIRYAHDMASANNHKSIVLVGHEDYYPRFGYELASKFGIRVPFEVPEINVMVVELEADSLEGINGVVQYPAAFFPDE